MPSIWEITQVSYPSDKGNTVLENYSIYKISDKNGKPLFTTIYIEDAKNVFAVAHNQNNATYKVYESARTNSGILGKKSTLEFTSPWIQYPLCNQFVKTSKGENTSGFAEGMADTIYWLNKEKSIEKATSSKGLTALWIHTYGKDWQTKVIEPIWVKETREAIIDFRVSGLWTKIKTPTEIYIFGKELDNSIRFETFPWKSANLTTVDTGTNLLYGFDIVQDSNDLIIEKVDFSSINGKRLYIDNVTNLAESYEFNAEDKYNLMTLALSAPSNMELNLGENMKLNDLTQKSLPNNKLPGETPVQMVLNRIGRLKETEVKTLPQLYDLFINYKKFKQELTLTESEIKTIAVAEKEFFALISRMLPYFDEDLTPIDFALEASRLMQLDSDNSESEEDEA